MTLASHTSAASNTRTPEEQFERKAKRLVNDFELRLKELLADNRMVMTTQEVKVTAWTHVKRQLDTDKNTTNFQEVVEQTETKLYKLIDRLAADMNKVD